MIETPISLKRCCDTVYTQYRAVWDTGSTRTSISLGVFKELSLSAIDPRKIMGIGGIIRVSMTMLDIRLPNLSTFNKHRVLACPLDSGMDVLIGMDIITACDFALCGYGGVTLFAFDSPPNKSPFDNLRGA